MTDAPAPPSGPAITPAQEHVLSQLRDGPRPTFGAGLSDDLRLSLYEGLAPIAEQLTGAGESLWVGKHQLARVHGCQTQHLHDENTPFEWSVAAAKGSVAHKAIELSVYRHGERSASVLAGEALGALRSDDSSLGQFVDQLTDTDRALLESEATSFVDAFLNGWPPLRRAWAPVVEARLRVNLYPDLITLAGRPDLIVGKPNGMIASRLIVDFKSGRPIPSHRDDARFYALLHTIRYGVPPFRVATYYLDSGDVSVEDVDVGLLDATLSRTVDGATLLAELRLGQREPTLSPGPICGWCPLAPTCDGATQWAVHQENMGV